MPANPLRTVITVVMDVLVVFAVGLCAGLVVKFFEATAVTEWGVALVRVAEAVSLPLGIEDIPTPYGGYFDVELAGTVVAVLLIEWMLSVARRQA